MPTLEIRAAQESDKAQLIRILRDSFLTTWSPMLPKAATEAFLRDKEAEFFTERYWQSFHIAQSGETMTGMIFAIEDRIESIHLDPKEKRKGYGSALMDTGEAQIKANGFDAATLDVLKDNIDAIAFYEARGYRINKEFTGREAGNTPVQMYLMERSLS